MLEEMRHLRFLVGILDVNYKLFYRKARFFSGFFISKIFYDFTIFLNIKLCFGDDFVYKEQELSLFDEKISGLLLNLEKLKFSLCTFSIY